MVMKTVLPWMTELIGNAFDPYNAEHCRTCQKLLTELLDYDPLPEDFSALLEGLVSNFHRHIESICIPVVKNPKVGTNNNNNNNPNTNNGGEQIGRYFVGKQIGRVLKYMENLALFKDFLTPIVLAKEAWWVLAAQSVSGMVKLLNQSSCDVQVCKF